MITKEQLLDIMPRCDADKWLDPTFKAMHAFQINTPARVAAFLAQVAHETAELTRLEENLNYSADGLLRVFRSRFTPEKAQAYARQPQKIANYVYANRYGNGDEASGDGWRYRGKGPFQLTFRGNYEESQRLSGHLIVEEPDLMLDPYVGMYVSAIYWLKRGCNELADKGQFSQITKKINPAMVGHAERTAYYTRALRILEEANV